MSTKLTYNTKHYLTDTKASLNRKTVKKICKDETEFSQTNNNNDKWLYLSLNTKHIIANNPVENVNGEPSELKMEPLFRRRIDIFNHRNKKTTHRDPFNHHKK